MNGKTNARTVDVLAAEYLRELAGDYRRVGHLDTAAEIEAQAAAVAVLVEAAREMQAARDAGRQPAVRCWDALRAALARFGGAK